MKLFISWSGERSKALAEALRDWIPLVLHYAAPWLSADIEAGERWGEAVAKELEASNFGIICVTRENADTPWILFEAGALAKSLKESKVIPLLLDHEFRDITGPLTQFQAKKVEKSDLEDVVRSINQEAGADAEPAERMTKLFELLWPDLEEKLSEIPEQETSARRNRPQSEVLEELVGSVRALDSRFREMSDMPPDFSFRRRRRRMPPFMLDEIAHMIGEEPGDPIVLLMGASMFRDEMPWLYELGVEAYRAAKGAPPEEVAHAMRRFLRAAELFEHGPFTEELGVDSRELHMFVSNLRHFLEMGMAPEEPEPQPRPRRRRQVSGQSGHAPKSD